MVLTDLLEVLSCDLDESQLLLLGSVDLVEFNERLLLNVSWIRMRQFTLSSTALEWALVVILMIVSCSNVSLSCHALRQVLGLASSRHPTHLIVLPLNLSRRGWSQSMTAIISSSALILLLLTTLVSWLKTSSICSKSTSLAR